MQKTKLVIVGICGLVLGLVSFGIGTRVIGDEQSGTHFHEQARSADSFDDYIGFNTYISDPKGFPGLFKGQLLDDFKQMHVRHIRINIPNAPIPRYYQTENLIYYYQQAGIKSTLTIALNRLNWNTKQYDYTTPLPDIGPILHNLNGAADAIEGPNEYDNHLWRPDVADFPKWTNDLVTYMKQVHDVIKNSSDPIVRSTAIYGPTFVGGKANNPNVGDYSAIVDYGNVHNYSYPYQTPPNPGGRTDRDNGYWGKKVDYQKTIYSKLNNNLVITELGFTTSQDPRHKGVTPIEQAKYIPRQLLDTFNQGFKRAFIYQIKDNRPPAPLDAEGNYGILQYDGTPKPSFTALKNLTSLLHEPNVSATFQPASMTYALVGDLGAVEHTLLQKSNGDFYLIIWQQVDSSVPVTSRPITLRIDHTADTIQVFDPLNSADPQQTVHSTKTINLNITDSPQVVQISGK